MNGSVLVSLAASVVSFSFGPGSPMFLRTSSALSPLPWVASQRGDSGSVKRNSQTMSAPMPITIHTPRHPIESRNASVNSAAIGHTQAPPMK